MKKFLAPLVAITALVAGCATLHASKSAGSGTMTMPDGTTMTAAQMAAMPAEAPMPDMVMATGQPQTLTANGAPAPEHDPANQPQISLGQAVATAHARVLTNPQGVVVKLPALGDNSGKEKLAKGALRGAVPAPTVTPGARQDGCAAGYGELGQCVPLRAPGNVAWTCKALRLYFPNGVTAHPDQWKLDTNGDGIACGAGDTA